MERRTERRQDRSQVAHFLLPLPPSLPLSPQKRWRRERQNEESGERRRHGKERRDRVENEGRERVKHKEGKGEAMRGKEGRGKRD